MKKKFSLIVAVFVLTLSLAGCGSEKKALEYNPEQLQSYAEAIISSFSQMDEATFQSFEDSSELQINMMLMNSGLPMDREAFISMIHSWNAAMDECGQYVEHGAYEVTETSNSVVLTTEAVYEERHADIAFKFDEKLQMESMDVSAQYSLPEILQKAGMNTLLGMGTVFIVLIFLAFIISLLKYIPAMFDKKQSEEETTSKKEKNATAVQETVVEETEEDDYELVAVIAAAIAAQEGMSTDDFVVRSIRRRPSNNWN